MKTSEIVERPAGYGSGPSSRSAPAALEQDTIGKAFSPGSLRRMPGGIGPADGRCFVSSFVSNRSESHAFSPVVSSLADGPNCPKRGPE